MEYAKEKLQSLAIKVHEKEIEKISKLCIAAAEKGEAYLEIDNGKILHEVIIFELQKFGLVVEKYNKLTAYKIKWF